MYRQYKDMCSRAATCRLLPELRPEKMSAQEVLSLALLYSNSAYYHRKCASGRKEFNARCGLPGTKSYASHEYEAEHAQANADVCRASSAALETLLLPCESRGNKKLCMEKEGCGWSQEVNACGEIDDDGDTLFDAVSEVKAKKKKKKRESIRV